MLNPNVTLKNGTLVPNQPKAPKFKSLPRGADDVSKAVRCFLTGGIGKFGAYVSTENALVYRTLAYARDKYELRQDICALRITRPEEVLYLGNSSILPNIGRTVSFGEEKFNRRATEVQNMLSDLIPMLPFNVFTEAGLNLCNVNILERGPEENVIRREENPKRHIEGQPKYIDVTVHFTGASLFEVDGRCFLFDLDRREIEHKTFNPFLVQLPKPAKTIAEAYDSLKPAEVKDAEARGLKVLRQGEWFFIPVKGKFEALKPEDEQWDALEKGFQTGELRAGANRPNRVSRVAGTRSGVSYDRTLKITAVSGFVEHTGREHARLDLKGWYKPVPNTSVQSFTITGDVD